MSIMDRIDEIIGKVLHFPPAEEGEPPRRLEEVKRNMGYKCQECGNATEFEKPATDHITVVVDGKGDYMEAVKGVGNMVITDEFLKCHKCGSENVVNENT